MKIDWLPGEEQGGGRLRSSEFQIELLVVDCHFIKYNLITGNSHKKHKFSFPITAGYKVYIRKVYINGSGKL